MIIFCGCNINFTIDVKDEAHSLLYLLAVYYCFDLAYPASYGLMYLIDTYCLDHEDEKSSSLKKAKSPKIKTKIPACWTKFLKIFKIFQDREVFDGEQHDDESSQLTLPGNSEQ